MKTICILVPDGQNNLSTVASIVGTYEIFARAGEFWKERNGTEINRMVLCGISDNSEYRQGLFSIKPELRLDEIGKSDLIILPSLSANYQHAVKDNDRLIAWIAKQYRMGAEVACICSGAFLLASSGILNGRVCSTHWAAHDQFRQLFPDVRLLKDQIITDENGIYTNGGAYSFLNLAIYLVEKYYDRETAIFCSKLFQIEIDRQAQSAFTIFKGQKQHADPEIMKAQEYIEQNINNKFSVADLSARFAIGRRNFDRRFLKATGNTALEYAQRVRIEAAKKAFETSRKTIQEVMYEVGYTDTKSFREVFRKITGLPPLAYRERYSKFKILSSK
jgi:transcriptional regulator GlxA family with amidase domain